MEDILRDTHPHLYAEMLRTLREDLSTMGVKEADDSVCIKEDDIRHLLSMADCRK